MSGVFHLLPLNDPARPVLQRLDHAAIFVLIAGTFTPVHTILFRGFRRWAPLAVIWIIAVTGITLKSIYFTQISEGLSTGTYLGMGWLGLFSVGLIWWEWGFATAQPLISGAFYYSFGAIIDYFKEPMLIYGIIGPHELFHIAVLLGLASHWRFIWTISHETEANCLDGKCGSDCAKCQPA
jgi:channel protein (hemolysin III family)